MKSESVRIVWWVLLTWIVKNTAKKKKKKQRKLKKNNETLKKWKQIYLFKEVIMDDDKFIITEEFIKKSNENFRKEPMYEAYIKPLIQALGKD